MRKRVVNIQIESARDDLLNEFIEKKKVEGQAPETVYQHFWLLRVFFRDYYSGEITECKELNKAQVRTYLYLDKEHKKLVAIQKLPPFQLGGTKAFGKTHSHKVSDCIEFVFHDIEGNVVKPPLRVSTKIIDAINKGKFDNLLFKVDDQLLSLTDLYTIMYLSKEKFEFSQQKEKGSLSPEHEQRLKEINQELQPWTKAGFIGAHDSRPFGLDIAIPDDTLKQMFQMLQEENAGKVKGYYDFDGRRCWIVNMAKCKEIPLTIYKEGKKVVDIKVLVKVGYWNSVPFFSEVPPEENYIVPMEDKSKSLTEEI